MIVCCIQYGNALLHLALKGGHVDVALMLIERGANVADKDRVKLMTDDAY